MYIYRFSQGNNSNDTNPDPAMIYKRVFNFSFFVSIAASKNANGMTEAFALNTNTNKNINIAANTYKIILMTDRFNSNFL